MTKEYIMTRTRAAAELDLAFDSSTQEFEYKGRASGGGPRVWVGDTYKNASHYRDLNAAFSDLSNGDVLYIPDGDYTVTTAIAPSSLFGIRVVGVGTGSHFSTEYYGPRIRSQVDAGVCLTTNSSATSLHEGWQIENIHFIDETTSGDGTMLDVKNMSNWILRNVSCRPQQPTASNKGGTGIKVTKTGTHNSWGIMDQCSVVYFDKCFDFNGGDGHSIYGGRAITKGGGQIGFRIDGSVNKFFGVRHDGDFINDLDQDIGFDVAGDFNEFHGCSLEQGLQGFDFEAGAVGNIIMGGYLFSHTTAITFASGANNNKVIMPVISSAGTRISDSGTSNVFVTDYVGIQLDSAFGSAAPIGWSNDVGTYSGSGTPESAVTAPVGSIYLRTNGGASTTLYVKESGTGNTGWIAK